MTDNSGGTSTVFYPAILLEQLYPPTRADLAGTSFIGGAPYLPEEIEWPVARNGRPLHFIAQIDCSKIPRYVISGDKDFLVEHNLDCGVLYFFALCDDDQELTYGDEFPTRVIYSPNNVNETLQRKVPEGVAEICSFASDQPIYDNRVDCRYILNAYPKVPLRLNPYMSTREVIPDYIPDFTYQVFPGQNYQDENLFSHLKNLTRIERLKQIAPTNTDVNGFGYPSYRWPWLYGLLGSTLKGKEVDIPECYPWRWIVIERTALAIHGHATNPYNTEYSEGTEDIWFEIVKDTHQWIHRANHNKETDIIDENTAKEFHLWLREILNKLEADQVAKYRSGSRKFILNGTFYQTLVEGLHSAWPYVIASGNLEGIDSEFIEKLAPGHLPGNWQEEQIHQMFGFARRIQAYNTEIPPDHILLLQIASDRGANIMFGDVGMLQYWIKPEDLKKRYFDDVVAVVGN